MNLIRYCSNFKNILTDRSGPKWGLAAALEMKMSTPPKSSRV